MDKEGKRKGGMRETYSNENKRGGQRPPRCCISTPEAGTATWIATHAVATRIGREGDGGATTDLTPDSNVGCEAAETTRPEPPLDGVLKAKVELPTDIAYQVLALHDEA